MYSKLGRIGDACHVFDEMPVRDSFVYNSFVWSLGFNGFYEDALTVFDSMRTMGFSPNSVSVASAIIACGESGKNWKGEVIHGFTSRMGFDLDVRVANSLVSMYSKVGRLDLACRVFDDMPQRDLVSWNSMIMGYARSENWVKSFDVFRSMKVDDLAPNHITFLGLILSCAKGGDLNLGNCIHGHLICLGLLHDMLLGTSIMDMYSKCGRVDFAGSLFNELPEKTLVSWNSLISGYSQNGNDYRAVELFRRLLLKSNLKPDSITMANVIPSYACLGNSQIIRLIHGFIIKRGLKLDKDAVLGTAMVDAYGKCFDIESASILFTCVEKPNTATWNAMVSGYNLNYQACQSIQLFLKMLRSNIQPDSITLVILFQSCGQLGSLKQGMLVHGYCFSSGFGSNLAIGNAMIDMYMRCGCLKSSQVLFNSMPLRNVVTWNTLLSGYVKSGWSMMTLKLFRQMRLGDHHKPDPVTMITIIQACDVSACHVEMVHDLAVKLGLDYDTLVSNSLVDAYARNGFIDDARSLFEQMGFSRDQSSWNVMITGCGMNGQGEEASLLLSRMEKDGFEPNSVTFIGLLSSCSHSGMIEKGCEYFDLMVEKYRISPGLEHYTCMIDMFGRAGRLEEAYQLISETPEGSDCQFVWGALLSACRMSTNVELGKLAGERLLRVAPDNCGYYALLSNVYASAGMWDEAAKVRTVFGDGKLVKRPGLSMVKM